MNGRAFVLAALVLLPALAPPAAALPRTADSDNSFSAATELSASGSRSGSLDKGDDPSDFWKFSAESGLVVKAFIYTVEWSAASPDAVNFSLLLYDRNQKQVAASASNFQYEAVSALAVAGGIYYLEVRAVNGAGSYTLDWSAAPAQAVKDGDEIHGLLSDSGNRNADWYRVQLRGGPAPDIFKASMHEDAGAFFDLYFMDLWSEYSLWYDLSWWSDPDESVEAQATYAGWYYLWVSCYRGRGNYTLRITVTPGSGDGDSEPAGARLVPYNSSFYDSVDMAQDHYDWYRCELASGETVRASLRLDPAPTDMFALSILAGDLGTLEDGMRTNFVPANPPAVARLDRTIALQKAAPAAGVYYIVVMARVGLSANPEDLSDHNARSDYMLAVNLSAHAPGPSNHAPRALLPGTAVSFNANTTYELDLGALFEDPDGDPLRYAPAGNGSVRLNFSRPGKAVLAPDEYFSGRVNFTLNATDPEGLSASLWVDAEVRKVPFPPVIFDRSPSSPALSGANGTTLQFSVSARDPNRQLLSYAWSADGADLSVNGNVLSWKVPKGAGASVIRCTVGNADGNASTSWTVTATEKPPLRVTIVTPLNNTAVREGDRVTFYAVVPGASPAEQAGLSFAWSLDGAPLSSAAQFSTTSLPQGKNTIVVTVSRTAAPAESGTAGVVVFVEEGGAGTDYTVIIVAAAIIVALGAALGTLAVVRGARRARLAAGGEDGRDRERRRSRKKSRKRSGR